MQAKTKSAARIAIALVLACGMLCGCKDKSKDDNANDQTSIEYSASSNKSNSTTEPSQTTSTDGANKQTINNTQSSADNTSDDIETHTNPKAVTTDDAFAARKRTDDATISAIMREVLTFEDAKTYAESRDALKASPLSLADDSPALTSVFPEKYVKNSNMAFQSLDSYITNTSGDKVSYTAIVTVRTSGLNNTSAAGEMLLTYTTDTHGAISGFDIYTISD